MNDESDEFLELFGEEIEYVEGARTSSGFYTTEKPKHITRFVELLILDLLVL